MSASDATKENVYHFVDESRHPPWAELRVEFGSLQEHKIRGYWECVQHYSKVGERTLWRNSECEMLGEFITSLDEIGISQWSSDQMGEGKRMFLRWFRSVCGTDERHSRSSRKMGRTSGRTQVVFILPRCSGYRFFMSMFNDIVWNTNDENSVSNAEKVKITHWYSLKDIGHGLGPGSEEEKYGSSNHVQEGQWNCTAANMVQRCKETGHLFLKVSVPSVVESWSKRKVKPPFTSTEILWTQNSCSKHLNL